MFFVSPQLKLKIGFRLLNRVMETLSTRQKEGLSQCSTLSRKYFGDLPFQIRTQTESALGVTIPQAPTVSSEKCWVISEGTTCYFEFFISFNPPSSLSGVYCKEISFFGSQLSAGDLVGSKNQDR